jgi:AraC-like DNA-binding protein
MAGSQQRSLCDAIAVIQRFVCAIEENRTLKPSLLESLPPAQTHADQLVIERLLSDIARKLDARGDALALSKHLGLASAVEVLATRRLQAAQGGGGMPSLNRPGRLRDIARDRGQSVRTLSRLSGKMTGLSAGEVRRRERMCKALDMLAKGTKGLAVAHECGYKSERSFYTAFRKYTHMTPAASRSLTAAERKAIRRRLLSWRKTA